MAKNEIPNTLRGPRLPVSPRLPSASPRGERRGGRREAGTPRGVRFISPKSNRCLSKSAAKENKLYKLITSRRSIRFFKQKDVSLNVIKKAVDCARLAPSAANFQFLEYLVVKRKNIKEKVFECLRFAAYVAPKRNPSSKQQPNFYIILLINKERSQAPNLRDIGAAAQNIMLSLLSFGVGSCWLQNIDKNSLTAILNVEANLEIDSIIAAGFPAEAPKLEVDSKNVKYWIDNENQLHVPKRPLKDVWHYNNI